jgi:hypothetical protein
MWRRIVSTIHGAFVRTPVEVIIAMSTAVACSAAIQDWIEPETLAQFGMTAFLLLTATFAASALHALKVFDSKTRWLITGVFGGVIAAYGGLWLDVEQTTELWRFAFLGVAAVMGVALIPVAARLGDASPSERFWRFNTRLIFRFAVAGAYAGLLYGGVALGVLAFDQLFELSLDDELYGHLFSLICLGLGPILAVGSLRQIARIDRPYTEHEMIWFGRLGTFLFVPLLLFYLGIMYLYLGKVMLTGDIPSNILSPLALSAGMLGYAGIFVLQPFLKRDDHKPLAAVLKAFPAAFIPLVPMGIWAIAIRVDQYGWTEFRYARIAALVCLGVFSLIGTWRWFRGRDFSLTFGPAIVGIVAFAGAVGPWGASYVSHASQKARLVDNLTEHGLIEADGRIASAEAVGAVPVRDIQEAREAGEYLLKAHGADALEELSPIDLAEYDNRWAKLGALGLQSAHNLAYASFNLPYDEPLHFANGGTFTEFSVSNTYGRQTRGAKFAIERDVILALNFQGRNYDVSLREFVRRAEESSDPTRDIPAPLKTLPLSLDDGTVVGELVLRSVQVREIDPGEWKVSHASGFVNVWD